MKLIKVLLYLMTLSLAVISTSLAEDPPAKLKLRDSPAPTTAQREGDKDPTTGMEFVFVKGGCYKMGSNDGGSDEKPVHEVCVSDFSIGKYEVTQGQYDTVMGSFLTARKQLMMYNPSNFKQCGPDCPVDNVTRNNAREFIGKLNAKSGRQYRLPTEAEWEYSARSGGKDEKWAGTNDESGLGKYAWYKNNSGEMTHRVGLKKANGLGIHDMSGNVSEMCQDWYNEAYYEDSPKGNPLGANIGEKRVLRGGSFNDDSNRVRTSKRDGESSNKMFDDMSNFFTGFRLVLPAK